MDPFNIFKEAAPPWNLAHGKLVSYFEKAFALLAGHHNRPDSLQYLKTLELMTFPEPKEFGLGYLSRGKSGAGTGIGFARRIVEAMSAAIEAGLSDLAHFEELGFLVEKIGRDRISDITCNILKPELIEYTKTSIAREAFTTETLDVPHAIFDEDRRRWLKGTFDLVRNPFANRAVLLVPKRFLDELPALNAVDWWNHVQPSLRRDLNISLNEKVDKARIVAIARSHSDSVRRWTEQREQLPARPYPVDRDPQGVHNWQQSAQDMIHKNPLAMHSVKSQADLEGFLRMIVDAFRLFVEHQGGWRLLFNDDTGRPKRETSVQLLFKGVVQGYANVMGVRIDREVDLGRGPVDFAITAGERARILLEMKKMNNGRYWHGLEDQLVSYMTSDQCSQGWFMAVRYDDSRTQEDRTIELPHKTRKARESTGFDLRSVWVDARPKLPASKVGGSEMVGGSIVVEDDEDFLADNGENS